MHLPHAYHASQLDGLNFESRIVLNPLPKSTFEKDAACIMQVNNQKETLRMRIRILRSFLVHGIGAIHIQ
jgi:hypothetical protein